jgi:flavin-binding protein dodecin
MSSVAKVTEIIASSPEGFEAAIRVGIERANETLTNIQGAWVKEQNVTVKGGKVDQYRVTLKVTFVLND